MVKVVYDKVKRRNEVEVRRKIGREKEIMIKMKIRSEKENWRGD